MSFWNTFLLSGIVRCFRIFPCSSSGSSHFPKEPWFLWEKNNNWKSDLGTRCTHCCCGVAVPRSSQWTELGLLYTQPHPHLFLCLSVCTKIHELVSASPILTQYYRVYYSFLSFVITSLRLRNLAPFILNILIQLIPLSELIVTFSVSPYSPTTRNFFLVFKPTWLIPTWRPSKALLFLLPESASHCLLLSRASVSIFSDPYWTPPHLQLLSVTILLSKENSETNLSFQKNIFIPNLGKNIQPYSYSCYLKEKNVQSYK